MNPRKIHLYAIALLSIFYILTYLLPLGARPMLRPDEFRYAEIPREMIVSGDWITPRLADIVYFEKPALGYQLTALSFSIFGENAFALRLPSALAVLITAAFLYFFLARKEDSDPLLPGLATGIYLTCGLVYGVGTFAVLDSQLTAALTLCIGTFFLALDSKTRLQTIGWLAAAGFSAGIAFLMKGFLAFAVPGIVIGAYLILQKNWRALFLYPWVPLLFALTAALPWSVAIHAQSPDFWPYFFWVEHWQRFTGSTFDRDPEPFWYFIPVLLGGLMPAGLLCAASWIGWKKWFQDRGSWKDRFSGISPFHWYLLLWAWIPFVFFSASSCKLGTYILPCFPPLAILIALGLLDAIRINGVLTGKILYKVFTGFGILIAAASVILMILAITMGISRPDVLLPLGTAVFWFIVWGGALVVLSGRKIALPILCAVFLFGMAPAICFGLYAIPARELGNKATEYGIREGLKKIPVRPGDVIFVDRNTIQPVAWTLKRTDLTLIGRPGELYYPLTEFGKEYASRWKKDETMPGLLEKIPAGSRIYIGIRKLKKYPLPKNWNVREQTENGGVLVARF